MRRAVGRVLAALAAAIALYVLYAHAAEWHVAREYLEEPIAVRFDGNEWARGLQVTREGDFEVSAEAGVLHVRGGTGGPGGALSRVEIRGPRRRLTPVNARLRLRVARPADVDVGVAVVKDIGPPAELGFGARSYAAGEGASWRFFGDESAEPPRSGDAMGKQRTVPMTAAGEEHEINLRIDPDVHLVLGAVDGVPVASHLAFWDSGEAVRFALFVRSRSSGQLADVQILQADYLPVEPDVRRRTVEDRFDGKVIDSSLWRVVQADGWDVDATAALAPGGGLAIRGHGLRPFAEKPGAWLTSTPRELASFRATLTFEAQKLHHARVHLGVSNPLFGLPEWRAFEIGLADRGDAFEAYAAGHWDGDQRFEFAPLRDVTSDAPRGTLSIEYDARTRIAVATLSGRPLVTRKLDLQPPEEVDFSFGVRAIDQAADFDVKVVSFTLAPLP